MRIKPTLLILILTEQFCFGQKESKAEEFQAALMQTKTGAMIVYNGVNHSFTLDIVGNEIKPTDESNFLLVDNNIFQSVIIPFSQKVDFENMNIETQKVNLLGYMNYELDYFKNDLKQKLNNEKYEWTELNGKLFLFWYYDMPKSNKQLEKQVYLTTICFDQILNINTPLERDKNDLSFNKELLLKIGRTLKMNTESIDLDALYKELKE